MAAGWCLAAAARTAAGEAERGRSDRLGSGGDRQLARAGVWGGEKTGPSPVDRSRSGSKHHLIACGRGTPLACSLTGGNRNDITQLVPLIDAIPSVRGRRGRPRRRPRSLYGDRAYHSREGRRELRRRRIQAKIAAPKTLHGSGLGSKRWVVERTIAWLHQYRRLRIATSAATTSTKPSSPSAAASSASSSSKQEAHSERRSKRPPGHPRAQRGSCSDLDMARPSGRRSVRHLEQRPDCPELATGPVAGFVVVPDGQAAS